MNRPNIYYFFLILKFTGRAITNPAKAPTTVEVLAEDEKHSEGSQPAKDAYANPVRLPITVKIKVIFINKYKHLFAKY